MTQLRISDYGMLADGRTGALVGRNGSVDWWCPGRFDAPSVFGRLLDQSAGHWLIGPVAPAGVERAYLPDTLVLRTVFTTPDGSVALTDALALEPGAREHDIGLHSPGILLRMVEGLSGHVRMRLEYAPRFAYGRVRAYQSELEGVVVAKAGGAMLALSGSVPLHVVDDDIRLEFDVSAGQRETFALAHAQAYGHNPAPPPDVPGMISDAAESWRSWGASHRYDGAYPDLVRRSSYVLQGLTYQPSGAVVAAPTTSLPEVLDGGRNYDYRFVWLRDFSLTLRALWVASCPTETDRLFNWVAHSVGRVEGAPMPIMHGVEGERDLTEHRIETMGGYAGNAPVLVGNEAWRQRQSDVVGEVLSAAWVLRDQLDPMREAVRRLLRDMADEAADSWRLPDAGMWEIREGERHHVSSKVSCWVALDRAIRFGDRIGGDQRQLARWAEARDEVRAEVLRRGWNERLQTFTGTFDSDDLDASLLVLPIFEFLPATDERMRATIHRIERELSRDGLVVRWPGEAASFTICSFWLASCLALAGEQDRAVHYFERITGHANDLGLLAEQIDPRTGEQLGNFPQAFSHIGLIHSAWRITKAEGGGGVAEDIDFVS
ncbi:glycoside hydrolase family 15 protein [Micromonospora sp. NPDC049559]|uniref:glycoside hydrolase family 15 protein n=1 Tax=Micromonospora sp. NPDC049559 TaxID=3155923 RepID=UPI003448E111